jgi:hypothetical protein
MMLISISPSHSYPLQRLHLSQEDAKTPTFKHKALRQLRQELQDADKHTYKDHPYNRHTTEYNTTHSLQTLGSSSTKTFAGGSGGGRRHTIGGRPSSPSSIHRLLHSASRPSSKSPPTLPSRPESRAPNRQMMER